ncbi:MAG: PBP1A family penicillin-binding protein [Firmicutes bacterium]|nr:PBP1A family penicillin-binding protein [Bacillota bacterium]
MGVAGQSDEKKDRFPRVRARLLLNRFRWLLVLFFLAGLGLLVFLIYNPWVGETDIHLLLAENRRASVLYDRNGETITTLSPARVIWLPLEKIPFLFRKAVIILEDQRFYEHRGFDLWGIVRAFYQNLRRGRQVQGGSTITQQLAKNLLLSQERTVRRKLAEISYAVQIEREYTKDEILEFYLNDIYFGHGVYGVEAAARFYFGRGIDQLGTAEMALLAGLIRGPEYYSPFRNRERAKDRRNLVLTRLKEQGILTARELEELKEAPLGVKEAPERMTRGGYFADYLQEVLAGEYGWSARYIRGGGLRIYSTIDLFIQRTAEEIISLLPGDEKKGPQGALVALDPKTGEILAMVGGRDYRYSQFNRATQARRQIGSAVKPLVFAAAVEEEGYDRDTRVIDEPVVYTVNGREWRPQNYDQRYRGVIPLWQALAESVNTVPVRIVHEMGVDRVFAFLTRMGLPLVGEGRRNDRALSPLALGGLTQGVTPLELAAAYTPLAGGGVRSEPTGILRVEDSSGRELRRGRLRRQQVLQPRTAAVVTGMMQEVITGGTGVQANPGRPAAGKTGTSSENTDAWFVGYTPDLLAVLWIGNDDRSPLRLGSQVLGSGTAALYWGEFMRRALVRRPVQEFPPP